MQYLILTEGEPVSSHELFNKLLSKKTITEDEEEESELKYLRIIEDIRDNNRKLFEKIKKLPKKSRTAKNHQTENSMGHNAPESVEGIQNRGEHPEAPMLLTFFRKGKLMKFYLTDKKSNTTREIDFLTAAKIFECTPETKKAKLPLEDFYELLYKNRTAFINATTQEIIETHRHGGSDNYTKLLKILKATQKNSKQLTEEQEEYLKKIITRLEEGALPKQTVKKTLNALNNLGNDIQNPLKVIGVLQREISPELLKSHYAEISTSTEERGEVILSLYLARGK